MTNINKIISRSEAIMEGEAVRDRSEKFKVYAVSNFRGGIGKSTISFNLAYEIANTTSILLLDTCSQRNLSQNFFGDQLLDFEKTLYDALISQITNTSIFDLKEIVNVVKPYCQAFRGRNPTYMIPGSTELFLFPSLLYSQLAQYAQLGIGYQKEASAKVLLSLKKIIEDASKIAEPEKVIVDTSPFFGGATHLSWCAAEAIIIPVRVDQHSIDALRLTLRMLVDKSMDFHKFNIQAGLTDAPKVHAIVMTHCGWSRQKKNTPDSSTKFFVQKALDIAQEYKALFSEEDVTECFYLLEDFHSSGRISGKQRIPLSNLVAGEKHLVDGQRLSVNPSVDRYKKQLKNLATAL
ncbi:ParA family protein [Nostoc sp. 'Peltigera membranacea cyanobiont' 232]|uniref:ParA family protein n=1 Tax=Nostoc sp. 'Peltigera membranacea cyanobiont' 232 TaxID=2014531 RepID=UPI000B9511A5|nr:ParA family protein [Nostoc sp. 'Peltigera membranacea cyanobiont' 232]OYE02737.1 hypothetical protein CDG79_22405 [Nostoc sp. 'Peltigera membranacea cyanobiont' 232]